MSEENTFSNEKLSGPSVDRRTTMKLLGAAGMTGLAGCIGGDDGGSEQTTSEQSSDSAQTGGRLQAGWFTGSVDKLDPSQITVGQYYQIAANVFNGLVTLKEDLTIRGDLAKDWTVENEGKTITFDLRQGVKFHNGETFTADDVKYTINRTISNETPAANRLSTLKPVDEGGVVVKDDHTVQLNFETPTAPALVYLTRGPGRAATIVNKKAIEEMGQEQYSITPVGTGPFEVTEHQVGSKITLDAFDDYFETDEQDNQLPYLDGIDIKPIPEAATLANAIRSGDVDFANLVPLQNVSKVENAQSAEKLSAPGVNWYGLAMNQDREPFGSRKARRGIAKVIDNEQYIQTAFFGNALPAQGPINKATNWAWREDKPDDQSYDLEKGKQLIEEAGADGASFSILTTKSDLRSAKAMRQQLRNAGFDVELDQVTSSTYWKRYEEGDYDTTIAGSVGDPDPDQSLYLFYRKRSEGGDWNWVNYANDEVHQLLAEQRQQLDREKRAETLQQLEDRLIADVPHAYLMHQHDIAAKQQSVKGFTHIPFMRNFHRVWLDK